MTTQEKLKDALKGITIDDVLKSERFLSNLDRYWTSQQKDRQAAEDSAKAIKAKLKGFKIPAHPIDHFKGWTTEQMRDAYGKMLEYRSGLPANDRKYLGQLCGQAYNLTIVEMAGEKYPEIIDELIPKNTKK